MCVSREVEAGGVSRKTWREQGYAPERSEGAPARSSRRGVQKSLEVGGADRDRTDDLLSAISASISGHARRSPLSKNTRTRRALDARVDLILLDVVMPHAA